MRIAICDDEPRDIEILKKLLKDYDTSGKIEIDCFLSADNFLYSFDKCAYDIVLLDIEMKGTNGYEAARLLAVKEHKPLVVFVTNSTEYTVRGYGIAFRYLVKPVNAVSLAAVMDEAVREVSANRFSFSVEGSEYVLRLKDIYYIEVYNHTALVHTIDEVFSLRSALKDILSHLPQGYFGMPHQSYIVNFAYVKTATPDVVKLTNSAAIPISRRKQKDFIRQLHLYLGR